MIISETQKTEFKTKGWTSVNFTQDTKFLKTCINSIAKIKKKIILGDWKYSRLYHDYFGEKNIAAIELPFHEEIIDTNLKELFKKIDLGKAVCELMGWNKTYCSLARIFTMNNKRYHGHWHRDENYLSNTIEPNIVQVGIFLNDQIGFKILKKEYDKFGLSSIVDPDIEELIINFPRKSPLITLQTDDRYYYQIKALKGSVLFFDPRMLHAGCSNSERNDYHMRFHNGSSDTFKLMKQNSFQDFMVTQNLSSNFDYTSLPNEVKITNIATNSFFNRILKSTNYYMPIKNLKHYIFLKKKFPNSKTKKWYLSKFSNTIFQKLR